MDNIYFFHRRGRREALRKDIELTSKKSPICHSRMLLSGIQQVDAPLKSAGMTDFWFFRANLARRSFKYSTPRPLRSPRLVFVTGFLAAAFFIGCNGNDGSTITESGTLEATEVTVSAQASGTVVRLFVDEGTSVREGDTLVVLDATDLELQLKQADAGLSIAEAQYKLTLEGMRKEDVLQAEANFKSAETDLQRMKELFTAKSVSQKQLDDAQTRFTIAQQTYEKAIKGSRQEEIIAARARRDQASAQVAALRKKVSDCKIVAPISGTVTKRYIERGELVGQGMAVVKLSNLQEMSVTVYLPEADIPKIQLGSTAQVQVDAFPERNFDGRVVFISPMAEFTPKNIQTRDERTKLVFGVKLKVTNPDGALKAGIPADVTFNIRQ